MSDAEMIELDATALRRRVQHAVEASVAALARRQEADGSWIGPYSGPTFLTPMYVLAHSITQTPLEADLAADLISQMQHNRNRDGSVGLYVQGPGTLFATVLTYTALRLLGQPPDEPGITLMRRWIHRQGGPLCAAPWAKFWLCLTGLYDYRGLDPVLPELWLLPRRLPLHPSKLFSHARQHLLPMSWLYARRATVPAADLIRSLRTELYERDYAFIPWHRHRTTIAPCDNLQPTSRLLALSTPGSRIADTHMPPKWRRRALDQVRTQLAYEEEHTSGLFINSSVACLAALVHHFHNPSADDTRRILENAGAYLWRGSSRADVQGCHSSQVWDTALAAQALTAATRTSTKPVSGALRKALVYLRDSQLTDDLPRAHTFHREPRTGTWPFTTRRHGWPVSDCTAEALLALHHAPFPSSTIRPTVPAAVTAHQLLSWQNGDGGWSSYEPVRGPRWLADLNPTRVFSDCISERSYTECTASVLKALTTLRGSVPADLNRRIAQAAAAGRNFLLAAQRPDGSFEGTWGICFIYGTWFGIEGLLACGLAPDHPAIHRAVHFLNRTQKPDGSWSETPTASLTRRYENAPQGDPVQTSWALLALCSAQRAASTQAQAAACYLTDQQQADGTYPQGAYNGMTMRSLALRYDNYRHFFPMWALAEWETQIRHTAK